jgi:hypothetical protein
MEETDVCYLTPTVLSVQQAIPNGCAAKTLGPSQRLALGVQALAGHQAVTALADELDVSRKFVYQQAATAKAALEEAFAGAGEPDDEVLFYLPVTKNRIRQIVVALVFLCHSSLRGVVEFCRDLLAVKISVGTVHNILQDAVAKARPYNRQQNLANVEIAGLDEIFQSGLPVCVGADVASGYCFLLSLGEHRDADTWGVHILDLQERGFAPKATIADFAAGIRAGQELAMPGSRCRGDTFHALQEITPVVSYLENRAYDAIDALHKLEQKKTKTKKRGRSTKSVARKLYLARPAEAKAVALADDMAVLESWLHYDIFAVSGMPYVERCELFDFICTELKTREELCPHRIPRVRTLLENHRDELLAFAAQLDADLTNLAKEFQVPVDVVRELADVQALGEYHPQRWQKEAALREKLRRHFHGLNAAVRDLTDQVVRASSIIENINSRLRSYFFLRKQLGPDYLELLQFFLNHHRFLRSDRPERVGKSPAELLTGQTHPHWLEMLGYRLFSRN